MAIVASTVGSFDHDGLETPFERGVLFDVLAVFVERGGADSAQLAAGKLRLQHVRGVGGAFRRPGARPACATRR